MRLFFAVALPAEVRAALGRLATEPAAYRWVAPDALHVTLAFLGEQPSTQLATLGEVGRAAAAGCAPGELRLGDAGSFGPRRAPRVLWLGLAGETDRLLALHQALDAALRAAGFPTEERAFAPHITLARRRAGAAPDAVAPWPPSGVPRGRIPLRALTLYESRLSPRGATYIPHLDFALGAGAGES
jgi:2'-5' RNA ligase